MDFESGLDLLGCHLLPSAILAINTDALAGLIGHIARLSLEAPLATQFICLV